MIVSASKIPATPTDRLVELWIFNAPVNVEVPKERIVVETVPLKFNVRVLVTKVNVEDAVNVPDSLY